ncbi:nitroreductase family protein [Tsuneonella sp. CC-YZS046]|uniref:nitroreductase family protein n=1 Tax=Tsuneonella sp. CC-YZS046 TaxID=3042152 RepID=UPI002D79FADD|nr:nitroreductase family protein [Tsuneonella sp. CC-YZS046]WRO66628.1 nitroreductase family protein [Tsuneonella sp. CC-YZS046]
MNETIRLLQGHRSDRDFTGEPIDEAQLAAIVEAGHRTPSHRNGQQITLVVVRDLETRRRIFDVTAGPQPQILTAPVFILVAVDFHKTALAVRYAGAEQKVHESLEGYTVGAVDAGITLATLSVAARSFGLGAVAIGAIRHDPQPIIDILGLPPLTYPIVGICIGAIGKQANLKPRLPIETYRHDERYDPDRLTPDIIRAFDEEMLAYWEAIGRPDGQTWTQRIHSYSTAVHPETKIVAARQGFTNIE